MRWLRAGEGIHEGHKPDEAWVQPLKDKIGIPRQDSPEGPQAKDREEGASCNYFFTQQSQKVIAQQILKNNQMVAKYNNLDAQLQNVTFE